MSARNIIESSIPGDSYYLPELEDDQLAGMFSAWVLDNQMEWKAGAWELEADGNVGSLCLVREVPGTRFDPKIEGAGTLVGHFTPWRTDNHSVQLELARHIAGQFDDSGESFFRKTYRLDPTGSLAEDWENYKRLLGVAAREADRAFFELGDQPARAWSPAKNSAWNEFQRELQVGDQVQFSRRKTPDGSEGLGKV